MKTSSSVGLCGLIIVSLLAWIHIWLSSMQALETNPALMRITQADFFLDEADELRSPPAESLYKTVSLPDVWIERLPEKVGTGWYKIQFEVGPTQNIQALFVSRLGLNANFYFDGQRIGGYGSLRGIRTTRPWNRPLMETIPGERVTPGTHTIHIELYGNTSHYTGLSSIYLGPEDVLLEFFNQRLFIQNTMALISCGLCLAGTLALFLIWRKLNRNESLLCLIIITSLMSIWMSGFSTYDLPYSLKLYAKLMYTVHFLMLGFMLQLVLMCQPQPPKKEAYALWIFILALLIPLWLSDVKTLLHLLWDETLIFAVVAAFMIYRCIRNSDFSFEAIAASLLLIAHLGLTANDYLLLTNASRFEESLISQYMGVALFTIAGYYLLLNFIKAFDIRDENNRFLKSELLKNELKLKQQFEQLALVERTRFQQEEREALMADMHDGIGSQLISTVAALRIRPMAQQDVVNVLQQCIDDLRLTIDSLEPTHQDILTLLGNFRYRMEPRLKLMGIHLKWGVNDVPDLAYLNPRSSLQFLRIVQEAFANIVKHAHCNEIGLKVSFIEDHIEVRIEDDGLGSNGSTSSNGKGLKNMHRRAEQMGLTLTAGNRVGSQGFEIVICLPVTQ